MAATFTKGKFAAVNSLQQTLIINPLLSDLFLFKAFRVPKIKPLAQVVQTLDSTIHRITHYPA